MDADLLKTVICNKVLHIDPSDLAATVKTVCLGYMPFVKRTDTNAIIWVDAARDTYIDAATDAAIALTIIAESCQPPQ